MNRTIFIAPMIAAAALAASAAVGGTPFDRLHTELDGFKELGVLGDITGAILTQGHGHAEVQIDRINQVVNYSLTYSDTTSQIQQAHIHFGKVHVAGGIMAFLCSNLGNAPAGTPACPTSGTVTGSISVAQLLAVPGENIPANEFTAIEEALDTNTAYVNVHSKNFPAGEIRGELER